MTPTRRDLLRAGAAGTLAACTPGPIRTLVEPPDAPNILLVFPDQLRSMSIDGPDLATPALRTFLSGGAWFPEAITTDPLCTPARATLVTGMHPHQVGIYGNYDPLPHATGSIARSLAAAGYETGFIGKWHLAHTDISGWVPPESRAGFAWWAAFDFGHNYFSSHYFTDTPEPITPDPPDLFEPIYQTELALSFMEEPRDRPFFLMLGYGPPHPAGASPIDWTQGIPEEFFAGLDPDTLTIPPNVPEWILSPGANDPWGGRLHLQGYLAAIASIDACLQKLIDGMKARGLWENTLVILTSDHGEMGGAHGRYAKTWYFEEALRVPLSFHWPAVIRPGRHRIPVSTADIVPTVLGLAGVDGGDLPGNDLSSWVLHGVGSTPGPTYFKGRQTLEEHFRGVRTPEWKYVSFDSLQRRRLFDLRNDPWELHNLGADPEYRGIRDELDAWLHDEQERLADV